MLTWRRAAFGLLWLLCQPVVARNIPVAPPYLNIGGYVQWYMINGGRNLNINQQDFFRRVRLDLNGAFPKHWSYMFEYDFAYKGHFRNVWLDYHTDEFATRLGQQKMPFNSVYDQDSVYNWFNEWSMPTFALSPNFQRGGAFYFTAPAWTAACSFFIPSSELPASTFGQPIGSTQRLFVLPYHNNNNLWQLGVSNWYQHAFKGNRLILGAIPEATGYRPVFTIRTPIIDRVSRYDSFEAETLLQYQRFAMQSGAIFLFAPRLNTGTLKFSGWYSQFSFFATQTQLEYNQRFGVFTAPTTLHSAVQFVARVSGLNLNSHQFHGGSEVDVTVGVNNYLLNHLKFGLNYVIANVRGSETRPNGHTGIYTVNLQAVL